MNAAEWDEKRSRGLRSYLLVDGILINGGPFAVVMQVVGYFLFGEQYDSFAAYFSAPRTWMTFILDGILFGLIVGLVKWRRNDRAFATNSRQE
jgi:hypothetical protein